MDLGEGYMLGDDRYRSLPRLAGSIFIQVRDPLIGEAVAAELVAPGGILEGYAYSRMGWDHRFKMEGTIAIRDAHLENPALLDTILQEVRRRNEVRIANPVYIEKEYEGRIVVLDSINIQLVDAADAALCFGPNPAGLEPVPGRHNKFILHRPGATSDEILDEVNEHKGRPEVRWAEPSMLMQAIALGMAANAEDAPPTAQHSGSAMLSLQGNTLAFDIEFSELSSSAAAIQLAFENGGGPAKDEFIDLKTFALDELGNSGAVAGSIDLNAAQKEALFTGHGVIRIQGENPENGAIQARVAPVMFAAPLSGHASRPYPIVSEGDGMGVFALAEGDLFMNVTYWGLSEPAIYSYIHGSASQDTRAPALFRLGAFANGQIGETGSFEGMKRVTAPELNALVDWGAYVNISTLDTHWGEIRGQITK